MIERLTKERIQEIHAEYSRPNHSKNFNARDCEISELAHIALQSFGNPEQLNAEKLNDVVSETNKSVCTCPSGDGSLRWPCPVNSGSDHEIHDGYVMVPIEPTMEMIKAAQEHHEGEFYLPVSLYRAMLSAAPREVK